MPTPITIQAYEFDELSESAKERARQWYRECDYDSYWSENVIDEVVEQGELMGIEFAPTGRKWKNAKTGTEGVDNSPRIYWSGFWSQGDGACFEGEWRASNVKANQVADGWGPDPATTEIKRIAAVFAEIAKEYPEASFSVVHRGHYSHENCTEFDFSILSDDGYEKKSEEIADIMAREATPLSEFTPEAAACLSRSTDKRREELWGDVLKVERDLKKNAKDFMRWIYRQLNAAYDEANSDEQVDENIKCNEYLFSEEGRRTTVLNL